MKHRLATKNCSRNIDPAICDSDRRQPFAKSKLQNATKKVNLHLEHIEGKVTLAKAFS